MTYSSLITSTYASGLIAYYPMDETSGTNADDKSIENNDGTYSGVVLNNLASPWDSTNAPSFDGVNDYLNFYSAAFNTDFGSTGQYTVSLWGQVSGSGIWTDGTQHNLFRMSVDTNNRLELRKDTTNNQMRWLTVAGATTKQITSTAFTGTGWFNMAITHDKTGDAVKAYLQGSQVGSTLTGLGVYAGSLASTQCAIGAASSSGATPWSGWISHVAIWNIALSAGAIADLYNGPAASGGLIYPFPLDGLGSLMRGGGLE